LVFGPGAAGAALLVKHWFRKDTDSKFLWPGYGENSRVLAWIFRRCEGTSEALETPIGRVPTPGELDLTGLNIRPDALSHMLEVDRAELQAELPQITKHLERFGERLPAAIGAQLRSLAAELKPPRNGRATASKLALSGGLASTQSSTTTGKATPPRR
jgi:phosphoenolpyruvate carboxykinase (GTP)